MRRRGKHFCCVQSLLSPLYRTRIPGVEAHFLDSKFLRVARQLNKLVPRVDSRLEHPAQEEPVTGGEILFISIRLHPKPGTPPQ